MAKTTDDASDAVNLLIDRSRDVRLKVLGIGGELLAVARAIKQFSVEINSLYRAVSHINSRLDDMSHERPFTRHAATCECRDCCLRRLVSHAEAAA